MKGHIFNRHLKAEETFFWQPQRKAAVLVQLLSPVWLSATPQTAARQASLSFTISWSLLKHMFIESHVHLVTCLCSLSPKSIKESFPGTRLEHWLFSFFFPTFYDRRLTSHKAINYSTVWQLRMFPTVESKSISL